MSYASGDTFQKSFPTHDSDGALVNADSLPTATLRRNGTDSGESVTVTNNSTGDYTASGTIPSGWDNGDDVEVVVSATVGGVTAKLAIGLGQLQPSTANVTVEAFTGDAETQIDDIQGKVASIGTANFTITSPVTEDEELELVAGDSYLEANGRALEFTYDGDEPDSAELCLVRENLYWGQADAFDGPDLTRNHFSIAESGGTVTVKFELTKEQSASLATHPPGNRWNHVYQFRVTDASGRVKTIAIGNARVKRSVC